MRIKRACIELESAWYLDHYTAWLTRSSKGRQVLTKDPRVSTKDHQVPRDLHVFNALKAPALSDLTRKSVHCNPPPKGKCRARGKGSSGPKSITAS